MLNSHIMIAKRLKNVFQPADPIILPETPEIPALSGEHLRNGVTYTTYDVFHLKRCSKWSTSHRWFKSYFSMLDIEILALNIVDKR
jgi:hypothetical protein